MKSSYWLRVGRDNSVRSKKSVEGFLHFGAVLAKVGAVTAEEKTARIDLTVTFNGDTVLGKAQVLVSFADPA
jgi:hypothetical protein